MEHRVPLEVSRRLLRAPQRLHRRAQPLALVAVSYRLAVKRIVLSLRLSKRERTLLPGSCKISLNCINKNMEYRLEWRLPSGASLVSRYHRGLLREAEQISMAIKVVQPLALQSKTTTTADQATMAQRKQQPRRSWLPPRMQLKSRSTK